MRLSLSASDLAMYWTSSAMVLSAAAVFLAAMALTGVEEAVGTASALAALIYLSGLTPSAMASPLARIVAIAIVTNTACLMYF